MRIKSISKTKITVTLALSYEERFKANNRTVHSVYLTINNLQSIKHNKCINFTIKIGNYGGIMEELLQEQQNALLESVQEKLDKHQKRMDLINKMTRDLERTECNITLAELAYSLERTSGTHLARELVALGLIGHVTYGYSTVDEILKKNSEEVNVQYANNLYTRIIKFNKIAVEYICQQLNEKVPKEYK